MREALKACQRRQREVPLDDQLASSWPDAQPSPEALLEHAETTAAIQQALAGLSPNQRAVVVLRYYLEWNETEIAAALHSPPGTIRWWLSRARAQLKRRLFFWDPRPVSPVEKGGSE